MSALRPYLVRAHVVGSDGPGVVHYVQAASSDEAARLAIAQWRAEGYTRVTNVTACRRVVQS